MPAAATPAWTRRTSTLGRPVSQVMVRCASAEASASISSSSRSSSEWVTELSGRLRSTLRVVVKPLTSSPAMPMTTLSAVRPDIASASSRAARQFSTTAGMSATVPDCMCDRPCRCRPTPVTTAPSPSSCSKTSALAYSVPMSSARCAELGVTEGTRRRRRCSKDMWRPSLTPAVAREASAAQSRGRRAGAPCPAPSRACPHPCRRLR